MKPFMSLIALVLLAALAAPFFLKVNDKPLMTVDDVIDVNNMTPDVLKSKTEVYRWQDEHGVWQFGEQPPFGADVGANAERIEIEEKHTPIGRGWAGPGGNKTSTIVPKTPSLGGLMNPKKVMDDAKTNVDALNARTHNLGKVLEDVNN